MCADSIKELPVYKTYSPGIIACMYFACPLKSSTYIGYFRSHFYFVYMQKSVPIDSYNSICIDATKLVTQLQHLQTQTRPPCISRCVPCLPFLAIFFQ